MRISPVSEDQKMEPRKDVNALTLKRQKWQSNRIYAKWYSGAQHGDSKEFSKEKTLAMMFSRKTERNQPNHHWRTTDKDSRTNQTSVNDFWQPTDVEILHQRDSRKMQTDN